MHLSLSSNSFLVFVPPYLENRTWAVLRDLMVQAPLDSDDVGFIYALEVTGMSFVSVLFATYIATFPVGTRPDLIQVKVGRTNDVARRFREHRHRCPSLDYKLLGYYPPIAPPPSSPVVRYCDRLERLVHIELADLAANSYPAGRTATRNKCADCQLNSPVYAFRAFSHPHRSFDALGDIHVHAHARRGHRARVGLRYTSRCGKMGSVRLPAPVDTYSDVACDTRPCAAA